MLIRPSSYSFLFPLNDEITLEVIDALVEQGNFQNFDQILYSSLGVALFFGILRVILTKVAFRVSLMLPEI